MALDSNSMMLKVKAAMDAVPAVQVDGGGDPSAYRDAMLTALCAGIIEEIQTNADVPVTGGSSAGTYKVQ